MTEISFCDSSFARFILKDRLGHRLALEVTIKPFEEPATTNPSETFNPLFNSFLCLTLSLLLFKTMLPIFEVTTKAKLNSVLDFFGLL